MTSIIRIQHIATADTAVRVVRHRQDVPNAEPHSLVSEDTLGPGEAITLTLHPGEIVTVAEAAP